MKILYHHRTQAEDGQAVHIRALQRAWVEEGHQVVEVSLVSRSQGTPGKVVGGAPSPAWAWVTRMPRFARELAEYGYTPLGRSRLVGVGRREQPDFLYERYAFGNAAGVMAAKRLGVPIVLEVNSPMAIELEQTRGLTFRRTAERFENWVFRSAQLVCVVTAALGEILVRAGVDPGRIVVTPNGVHLGQYEHADAQAARASARRSLGLGADALVLGFVGYYRDWHRLDLVIDALTQLAGCELVLVGEGPAREDLERRARAAGVFERVHFAGRRDHDRIPALLPAFDVALLPAINPYASPLKLHEYMASSLPVLAPDQPNLREILGDGENALLVPPEDGPALTSALGRLVGDPDLRRRLGEAARRTIVERDLTWRGNARRVIRAVQELPHRS